MPEVPTSPRLSCRVAVYERRGRAGTSPATTVVIAAVSFAILSAIIMEFKYAIRYAWDTVRGRREAGSQTVGSNDQ
jgi:hypothetical protein